MNVSMNLYICALKSYSASLLPEGTNKMYTTGITANSQRISTKISENSSVAKIKNFSGRSDTIRHLKIFRIISNEMPVLLLILC